MKTLTLIEQQTKEIKELMLKTSTTTQISEPNKIQFLN